MKKIICTIAMFFCFLISFGQLSKTDSLTILLFHAKDDTSRVNILNNLAYEFRNNNPDSSLYFANQSLVLATKSGYEMGSADAHLWTACAFFTLGDYTRSLKSCSQALVMYNMQHKSAKKPDGSKILKQTARVFHTMGNVYFKTDNYPEALKNYKASLKIKTIIGDEKGITDSQNNIGLIYDNLGNFSEALNSFSSVLKIAGKTGDKKGMAIAHTNIGNINDSRGDFSAALNNYFTALKLNQEIENKNGISSSYHNIGNIYLRQGNYPKALENYMLSLKIREESGDKFGMAQTYNNIANVYILQKNYPDALKNGLISLEIRKQIEDKRGISDSYSVLGVIHERLANYQDALKNHTEALKIRQEIGDKKGIGASFFDVGSIYSSMGNYPEALVNVKEALKIRQETGEKKGIAECYSGIGKILTDMKKYLEASEYLNKGLVLSTEINSLEDIKEGYYRLSELENARGNYKQAMRQYKMYVVFRDSLYNDENTKKTVQVQMQYDFDKKETATKAENNKQKALAQAEIKRQKVIKNSAMGGIAVLILAGLTSFAFYKRRRDAEQQKKESDFKAEVSEVEMKALRSQMNPHFIFNSLNSISDYISRNDNKTADNYLTKFAKVMRMILENSEHKEVPLQQDLKALELYMQLESLRMKKKFHYEIKVDESIDAENTLIPPLILQPFVENSIWHGLAGKKGEGKISIHINKVGEMIECTVEDNGVGRKKSEQIKSSYAILEKKSLGMKITKARIDILNKIKKSKAGVELVDLAEGMKVIVRLPLELSF